MGGIANSYKMDPIAIGGMVDHVHLLLKLPSTISIARGIQLTKANSSKWLSRSFPFLSSFEWQTGYGAFSLCKQDVTDVVAYIMQQEQHHQRMTFQEEFLDFLKRYNVKYDPRYIWQ